MNIFSYFKRKGIDTVDASFYTQIRKWVSWYNANVRNFSTYKVYTGRGTSQKCERKSMGMAKKLSEDIADLLLNERVQITLDDEATNEYVQDVLEHNHFLVLGNDYQERKAYTGTVAYVPYMYDTVVNEDGEVVSGKIGINYVDAPNIYPVSWNNGDVRECIFLFPHTVNRKKYVQVQSHLIDNDEYVIENTVLESMSGSQEGKELREEEWRALKPFQNMAKEIHTDSLEPQFVIDRLNITNNADANNPMGVAIFANALDVLKKLDIEFDSYCNEFLLGRKRIFVISDVFPLDDLIIQLKHFRIGCIQRVLDYIFDIFGRIAKDLKAVDLPVCCTGDFTCFLDSPNNIFHNAKFQISVSGCYLIRYLLLVIVPHIIPSPDSAQEGSLSPAPRSRRTISHGILPVTLLRLIHPADPVCAQSPCPR